VKHAVHILVGFEATLMTVTIQGEYNRSCWSSNVLVLL